MTKFFIISEIDEAFLEGRKFQNGIFILPTNVNELHMTTAATANNQFTGKKLITFLW